MPIVQGPPRLVQEEDAFRRSIDQWAFDLSRDLNQAFDALTARVAALETTTANHQTVLAAVKELALLTQTITNPPTGTEVANIQDKVNAILAEFDELA